MTELLFYPAPDYGSVSEPIWGNTVLDTPISPIQARTRRTRPARRVSVGWGGRSPDVLAAVDAFLDARKGDGETFYFYTPYGYQKWVAVPVGTGDGLTAAFAPYITGIDQTTAAPIVKVAGTAKVLGTDFFVGYANRLLFSEDPRMVTGLTNLLTANQSSIETDTVGFDVVGAGTTKSRITTDHRFGAACIQYVCDGAAGLQGMSTTPATAVTAGQPYTFSCWVKLVSGSSTNWTIRVWDTGYVTAAFTPTSTWQRVLVTVPAAGAATLACYVLHGTASAATILIDGLQLVNSILPGAWAPGGTAATLGWMLNGGATAAMTAGQAAPSGPATATRIVTTGGSSIAKLYQSPGTPPAGALGVLCLYIKVDGAKDVTVTDAMGGSQTVVHGTGWTQVYFSTVSVGGAQNLVFNSPAAGDSIDFTLWHPWAAWTAAALGDPIPAWGYVPTQDTAVTADSLAREQVVFIEGSVPAAAAAVTIDAYARRLLLGRLTSGYGMTFDRYRGASMGIEMVGEEV